MSQTSQWFGAAAMAPSSLARSSTGDLHYTIIPLPVVPPEDVTIQRRRDAIQVSYQGRLQDSVDLYRATVEADGWMIGILDTMARGILGLPLAWQGDEELVAALQDQDNTPGDFRRMHPMPEAAKIFRDFLGLGFGLGQYLLMCWRCESTEWDIIDAPDKGYHLEICRRCRARRIDHPIGQRRLYRLMWRDMRWAYRNPTTLQWYYTGSNGMTPFTPGDGEWVLITSVPDCDIWRHGPWVWGTIAAIFARDSTYDRQNTSAVCAPTHVFAGKGSTDPFTRADIEAQAQNLQFNNRIILPGEWEHRIDAAKAEFVDVTKSIVEWASDMWEVGLTGNQHGRVAGPGFSNMDVFARTTRDHRAFFAQTWIDQIIAQGMRWWALENYGPGRVMPCGKIDVRSPEEKLAASKADEQEGAALEALVKGYAAVGADIEWAYTHERAQKRGIRIVPKQVVSAVVTPAIENAKAVILGSEARAAMGLAPFGDERDKMTMAELENAATGGAGKFPDPVAVAALAPDPSPLAARLEEEEGGEDEADAARLAEQYTAAGLDRCPYHGRTHACPRCGVQRVYALDEQHLPRIAWRPLRARAALRAHFDPEQPRDDDGKWGSGGGGKDTAKKKTKTHERAEKDERAKAEKEAKRVPKLEARVPKLEAKAQEKRDKATAARAKQDELDKAADAAADDVAAKESALDDARTALDEARAERKRELDPDDPDDVREEHPPDDELKSDIEKATKELKDARRARASADRARDRNESGVDEAETDADSAEYEVKAARRDIDYVKTRAAITAENADLLALDADEVIAKTDAKHAESRAELDIAATAKESALQEYRAASDARVKAYNDLRTAPPEQKETAKRALDDAEARVERADSASNEADHRQNIADLKEEFWRLAARDAHDRVSDYADDDDDDPDEDGDGEEEDDVEDE